jgi:hypothetical protein
MDRGNAKKTIATTDAVDAVVVENPITDNHVTPSGIF